MYVFVCEASISAELYYSPLQRSFLFSGCSSCHGNGNSYKFKDPALGTNGSGRNLLSIALSFQIPGIYDQHEAYHKLNIQTYLSNIDIYWFIYPWEHSDLGVKAFIILWGVLTPPLHIEEKLTGLLDSTFFLHAKHVLEIIWVLSAS